MAKKLHFSVTNFNTCPWPLCMLGDMLFYDFRKFVGFKLTRISLGEWRNRLNRWAVDEYDDQGLAEFLMKRLEKNPAWFFKNMPKIEQKCAKLEKFSRGVFARDLSKLSDVQLYKLYRDYEKNFKEMYVYGWIPNGVEGHANLFTKKLGDVLVRKLKKIGKEKEVGAYLSALTTPTRESLRRIEAKEFLLLIKQVLKNPAQKELLLNKHWQKYRWLGFDYDGPAFPRQYFEKALGAALKNRINPDAELKKFEKEKQEIIAKQKQFSRILSLNITEKQLFELGREMMYWKEYRKDILFQSYFYIDKLIREIGRRLGLSAYQVKHILPSEMKDVLVGRKYDADLLNERIKHTILVYDKKVVKIYSGKQAEKIKEKYISEEKIDQTVEELHGECAYPGKARGKVKIVNIPSDMAKMQDGDVLVSVATNPNLLPAMKKAAAIVTNKGGITCHAAIVARELKIPCVVGTKRATQILHDNDIIEVEATKGIVKIVK